MEGPARKIARKETPALPKNNDASQSCENTLDSNTYLTYDILRIIFQYLNARDLTNAAMVCRSWLEAANNEKSTRGPCCFIQTSIAHKSQLLDLNFIRDMRVKPSAGFFFLSRDTPCNIKDLLQPCLPKHCEVIMLFTTGIIMDNREIEQETFYNMVCAFLPQIPNVRIQTFKVAKYSLTLIRQISEELIRTFTDFQTSMSCHETSTCFMLLCNYKGYTAAKFLASSLATDLKTREGIGKVSVWGGIVDDIYAQRISANSYVRSQCLHEKGYSRCVAVLITGAIQMWSMILEKEYNTKEQVEEKLKKFKDQVKLKKHSVGFMFACRARGKDMYNESNVESTIFKRLFPKVPLVGCFGYGEFGKNTVDEESE
ncbi:hypothetical protein P5V15_007934 [Pogonomyrmex californicus]